MDDNVADSEYARPLTDTPVERVWGRYTTMVLCPEAAVFLRNAMADRENQVRVSWPTLNEWLTQLEKIMQTHQPNFKSFNEQPHFAA